MKIVIKTTNIKLTNALQEFVEEKINSLEKFSKIFYTEPSRRISTTPSFKKERGSIAKRVEISLLGEKYFNGFFEKGKPKVEAWVEVGKTTLHHQKGPWFYVECQMHFPKKSLRATAQRENLKLAITEVKDELQRELKKYKEKLTAQMRRRAGILKKDLKLSPLARFYRKGRIREEGM